MFKTWTRWVKQHPKKSVLIVVLALVMCFNGVACMHAHAMTHFTGGGERTAKPDELSAVHKAKVLLTGVRIPRPVNNDLPANHSLPFKTYRFSGPSKVEYEGWHIPRRDSRGLCILFHGYGSCKSSLLDDRGFWRKWNTKRS